MNNSPSAETRPPTPDEQQEFKNLILPFEQPTDELSIAALDQSTPADYLLHVDLTSIFSRSGGLPPALLSEDYTELLLIAEDAATALNTVRGLTIPTTFAVQTIASLYLQNLTYDSAPEHE